MAGIFDKVRLRPAQLRTAAERRFGDARYLCASGQNERANGAMYLAGFVMECLLKARLMNRYSWLQTTRSPEGLSKRDYFVGSLLNRSHDDEILSCLPEVGTRLAALAQNERLRLSQLLKSICSQWTIFARYSSRSTVVAEAIQFVSSVEEVKEWLK